MSGSRGEGLGGMDGGKAAVGSLLYERKLSNLKNFWACFNKNKINVALYTIVHLQSEGIDCLNI